MSQQQQQQGKMSDALILCLIATTDKVPKFMVGSEGCQSQKKRGRVVKLPEIES